MDENKLAKLRAIDYQIVLGCGHCAHGTFKVGADWGTCSSWQYQHGKHTDSKRDLSVNRHGRCEKLSPSGIATMDLEHFEEFVAPTGFLM